MVEGSMSSTSLRQSKCDAAGSNKLFAFDRPLTSVPGAEEDDWGADHPPQ
jgi:hypothetical protein